MMLGTDYAYEGLELLVSCDFECLRSWDSNIGKSRGIRLLELNQIPEAVKRLSVFRDKGEFQNLPGVTDRAAKGGQCWTPIRGQ